MWINTDKISPDSVHYSIMTRNGADGMSALRQIFPTPKADELNFVLFSTSGVHGTYNTIEEAELALNGVDEEGCTEVTYLICHPRLVAMRYGTCEPASNEDIEYLKQLRASSYEAVLKIGKHDVGGQ